jgi:SAM-dependent methyltransferase
MAEKHFYEQIEFSRSYLVPFLQKHIADFSRCKVLEIGCAEAGLLHVLQEMGVQTVGVELSVERVHVAKEKNPHLDVRVGDITDKNLPEQLDEKFDLIVMREVIEHVSDRNAAFRNLYNLLNDDGLLYITFPSRFSPFAGHQQVGRSILRRVPYLHYWPAIILKPLGRLLKEHDYLIKDVLNNYRIGLSLHRFERLCRKFGFTFLLRELYLIRPIYQQRFGWRPRKMPNIFFVREFLVTGCECLLRKR